ncbi:NUDIX hydrolase domain-like protein [Sparassis latifolia]|uniref:NUDIX domain-containing protein n=1 Tax=Sparassis crispa TaxID=139825 RepID=A0A401GR89_9APHY|nr:NUDIX domain-containing protein [Sparassis crispa]GBE84670.1 NUDIX domain-containing protein [Sparassis crispa]
MEARVGVGVFVLNDEGKFIMGRRKGSVGAGTWALPGGHLEFGESFEACAARELLEETGLAVGDVHFLTATNNVMEDVGKHYVTIFMQCRIIGEKTQPEIMEPDKCEEWEWASWEDVRSWEASGQDDERKLFQPIHNLFVQRPLFRPAHN